MIVNIKPSKKRFGRLTKRKQWQFLITANNGEPFSEKDTYANTVDITSMLHKLREEPMTIHIHFEKGVETINLPADPQKPF